VSELLACIIEQLVDRYGSEAVAMSLVSHLTPEQRMKVALQWEMIEMMLGRETVVDQLERDGAIIFSAKATKNGRS
jgi:hypothetical protein